MTMIKFLILAENSDETARRIYNSLRGRHGENLVKFVSGHDLIIAPYWKHQLSGKIESETITQIELSDGTLLDSSEIGIVFNRLEYVPFNSFLWFSNRDQEYAQIETCALWISWISSLPCAVINKITSKGMFAQNRSHAQWLFLASKAGLPTRTYSFNTKQNHLWLKEPLAFSRSNTSQEFKSQPLETIQPSAEDNAPSCNLEEKNTKTRKVLLVGNAVLGDLEEKHKVPMNRFRELTECDFMEVSFALYSQNKTQKSSTDDWRVCGFNAHPQVTDETSIEAVVSLLESRVNILEPKK
jgi:hypothetical protein